MNCPSTTQLSRSLIDDHLRAELSSHVATCDRCQHELTTHRSIADRVRDLPVYQPSLTDARHAHNALLVAARNAAPGRRPRWHWFAVGAGSFAAAVAIVLLVVRPAAPTYRAELHPQADAQFARVGASPDEIVRLSDGTMTLEVAPLGADERFRVITADAEVEVRGTAFDVAASHDHLQSVRVLHGRAVVRTQGRTIILADGERWEPQIARIDVVPAAPALTPTPAPAPAPAPLVASSSTTPSAPVAQKAIRPSAKPAHAPKAKPPVAQISTTVEQPPPAAMPKRQNELLFEQGWASLKAGKTADAATTFERAALAAPDDPLAEDAWFWRASSLARAKSPGASDAFDKFLSRYPHSPRSGEASAMLGWLVIDTHPDRAEKLFHVAESDPVPAVRASAQKGLANLAQRH